MISENLPVRQDSGFWASEVPFHPLFPIFDSIFLTFRKNYFVRRSCNWQVVSSGSFPECQSTIDRSIMRYGNWEVTKYKNHIHVPTDHKVISKLILTKHIAFRKKFQNFHKNNCRDSWCFSLEHAIRLYIWYLIWPNIFWTRNLFLQLRQLRSFSRCEKFACHRTFLTLHDRLQRLCNIMYI